MSDMTHQLITPLFIGGLGTTELLIIVGILVLLFGAKKLPELARGSGRALRIFKAETKGLVDDEDDDGTKTPEQRQIEAQDRHPAHGDPEPETRSGSEGPGSSGTTR
jgi:sec-independent protein translocase protein TatA